MNNYDAVTYGDRVAAIYDTSSWMSASGETEAAFLAGLVPHGSALELGIGTGRVALPLADRGLKVAGVEVSERMVAQLLAKPGGEDIRVILGDFCDFEVDEMFDLVFCVYSTFFLLTTQEEQTKCFARVAEALAPDGCFVLEVSLPPMERLAARRHTETAHVDADEVVLFASKHDPVSQCIERQQVVLTEGGTRLYPISYRYAWPSELDLMARLAGLTLERRYGGWTAEPFSGAGNNVSVYRKAVAV